VEAVRPAVTRPESPADAPAAPPASASPARRIALAALLPLAFLALWEAAVRYRWVAEGIVPAPEQVVRSWYVWIVGSRGFTLSPYAGTWLDTVLFSTRRVLQGFGLAALVGIPLGILIGWNRLVQSVVDPSIQMLRPIPITAWLPFSIAVFGIYDASALFLIGLGAFYPIVVNTTHGVRDTSRLLIRAARMLGAGEATILFKVVFPSALPAIFTGLRLGIGIAWTAVIVAEIVAVKSGLGYVLWDAYYVSRMDICVAAMISVGLLGFLSDRLISGASRRVLRWRALEAHT
jgi:NitT/TauT family transport system permease protein